MRQIDVPLPRQRLSWGEAAGDVAATLTAAVTLVVLPGLYLAVAAGVAWVAIDFLVGHLRLIADGADPLSVLLYTLPAVLVLGLVALLVKPLFRFPPRGKPDQYLDETQQANLYEYVQTLARTLGTPEPARVRVTLEPNAGAGFGSVLDLLWMRRLVVTLGLPFAAGLTLMEATAVLAHELAHLNQRSGMRSRYVVYKINGWLARVVYERDRFDLWLDRAAADPMGRILLWPVRAPLWLGRRGAWVLLLASHAASAAVSRQHEREADRQAARIVGSVATTSALRETTVLEVVQSAVIDRLELSWRERRLPDDLPRLVAARAVGLKREEREHLFKIVLAQPTQRLDTHPSLQERLTLLARADTPPLATSRLPGSSLFHGFEAMCKEATLELYRSAFDTRADEAAIVPTASIAAEQEADRSERAAIVRFFGGDPLRARPLMPGDKARLPLKPEDVDRAVEVIGRTRDRLVPLLDGMQEAYDAHREAEAELDHISTAQRLEGWGVPLDLDGVSRRQSELRAKREAVVIRLAEAERLIRRRFDASLRLLRTQRAREALGPDRARTLTARVDRLLDATEAMTRVVPVMHRFDGELAIAANVLNGVDLNTVGQRTRDRFDAHLLSLNAFRDEIAAALGETAYPFTHASGDVTLAAHLVGHDARTEMGADAADADESVVAYYAAMETHTRYGDVMLRLLSGLAAAVEEVEKAVGFEAWADPPMPDIAGVIGPDSGATGLDGSRIAAWLRQVGAAVGVLALGVVLLGVAAAIGASNASIVPHHAGYQSTLGTGDITSGRAPSWTHPFSSQPYLQLPGTDTPTYQPPNPYDHLPNEMRPPGYRDEDTSRPGSPYGSQPARDRYGRPTQPNQPDRANPSNPYGGGYRPPSPSDYSRPSSPRGPSPGGPSPAGPSPRGPSFP